MDTPSHFLITRFNVSIPVWNRDKAGTETLNDPWMDHRMALFNRYCAPTVAGQTETQFRWLIYCDVHTAPRYVAMIRDNIKQIPHAEIRFVDDFESLKRDLKQLLASSTSSFVITSRMDNDDGIGKEYIETIQKHFVPVDKTFINLNGGILYDADRKILTELPFISNNHFGSLIEKKGLPEAFITVIGFAHHAPPDTLTIVNVPCRFAWLKIIHSRNVKSRTNGVPLLTQKTASYFSLDKNVFRISLLNTFLYIVQRVFYKIKLKAVPQKK